MLLWLLLFLAISDSIVDPATISGTLLRPYTLFIQARTPQHVCRRVYITGAWQRRSEPNEGTMQHDAVSRDAMMRLRDRDYAVKAEYTDAFRELTSARVDAPIKARIQVDQYDEVASPCHVLTLRQLYRRSYCYSTKHTW